MLQPIGVPTFISVHEGLNTRQYHLCFAVGDFSANAFLKLGGTQCGTTGTSPTG